MKTVSDSYAIQMSNQYRMNFIKINITSKEETYLFSNADIISIQKVNDVDPLSRRLPKETLSFSIIDFEGNYNPSNPSGKWNALDENASLTIQFGYDLGEGLVEWLEEDQYFLSG